jgi:hypothetical protein
MKEFKQLKKPPINQIDWFKKRFKEIEHFYLTEEIKNSCCGDEFVLYDFNGTNDLCSNFYLELFGDHPELTENLMILLACSLYDAEDIEYYEIADNIKIVIYEICRHPDTQEKYNKLPTQRIFKNPNII